MKRFVRYFVQGLIILVPIGFTFWLLGSVFVAIDGWTGNLLDRLWAGAGFAGAGFITMLLIITGTGFLGSHFFTRRLVQNFERLLDRLPVVKMLHGSVRDLLNAVVGPERRFDHPVAVTLAEGVRALGFVTRESMAGYGLPDQVAVYFPQAYNFAGQVLLVARDKLVVLNAPSAEIMTFIVSGGISGKQLPATSAPAEGAAGAASVDRA
jgi:uncharacterized membrane protein